MRSIYTFLILLLCSAGSLYAQLNITFPHNRSVFQRTNQNTGFVQIDGRFNGNLDRVEAKLQPITPQQGTATDWQTIDSNLLGGSFTGQIFGLGGWYTLEVRGIKGSEVVMASTVPYVGIGEVFVVAGQSNAEGFELFKPNGASDDRVNSLNYQEIKYLEELPYWGDFSALKQGVKIAPRADSPWAWGELGDAIARRYNVPVLFFNTAYEGTKIDNWYKSMLGEPTFHDFFKFTFPRDTPYSNLRITLQNYINRLGIRAVLWQQGESDNAERTSTDAYYTKLRAIIERTRQQTGKDITWVVARVSFSEGTTYTPIITAQNQIVSTVANTFAGPNTDLVQQPRGNNVHFRNTDGYTGITDLARAWEASLTDAFFNTSIPHLPSKTPQLVATCNQQNQAILSLPATFKTPFWSNTSIENTIVATDGSFSAVMRDNAGNYFYSNTINVRRLYPTVAPEISAPSGSFLCPNTTLPLVANPKDNTGIIWNTGETTLSIQANAANNYFAFGRNALGCLTPRSNVIQTSLVPKPVTPQIALLGDKKLGCEGENLTLTILNDQYQGVIWNNGNTDKQLKVNTLGESTFTVRAKGDYGCLSDESNPVTVKIVGLPARPLIERSGPISIKAVNITSPQVDWFKDNVLIGSKEPTLTIRETGYYAARSHATSSFAGQTVSCLSLPSDAFFFSLDGSEKSVFIYPNPFVGKKSSVVTRTAATNVKLQVYTLIGQLAWEATYEQLDNPTTVDLSSLPSGLYLLHISYGGFEKTERILLE